MSRRVAKTSPPPTGKYLARFLDRISLPDERYRKRVGKVA